MTDNNDNNNTKLSFDNSMLSTFTQCQRKHNLAYLRHRKAKQQRISTTLGVAAHEIANAHFLQSNEMLVERIIHWSKRFTDEIADTNERQQTLARFNSFCRLFITAYPVYTATNEVKIITTTSGEPRWMIRYPEIPFELEIGIGSETESNEATRFMYKGIIDCIVEDGNGLWFVLEFKTSTQANNWLWREQWKTSTQLAGYAWAASLHTNRTVAGVIVISVAWNKNEALVTQEITKRFYGEELNSWRNDTITLMKEAKNSRHLPTGKYNGNCVNSHLGVCDFRNYCLTNCNEEILEQDTEYYVWDPLAIRSR